MMIMQTKGLKEIFLVLALTALIVGAIAWWIDSQSSQSDSLLQEEALLDGPLSPEALENKNNEAIMNPSNPKAVFTTNKGVFEIELFESDMPITVGNFAKLAEEGFYNGTKFHRVIDGFMIQGGDPNSKGDDVASYGQGGPDENVQDEFVAAAHLSNVRGTISMANTGQPNSGGSQFFINTVDNLGLDFDKQPLTSKHPVFGHVVSGMDVVDAISSVETGPRDLPVEPVIVESITIVRN